LQIHAGRKVQNPTQQDHIVCEIKNKSTSIINWIQIFVT